MRRSLSQGCTQQSPETSRTSNSCFRRDARSKARKRQVATHTMRGFNESKQRRDRMTPLRCDIKTHEWASYAQEGYSAYETHSYIWNAGMGLVWNGMAIRDPFLHSIFFYTDLGAHGPFYDSLAL